MKPSICEGRRGRQFSMIKRKLIRDKGKIKLSRYFQEFQPGERVAVVRELSLSVGFPARMQGRTGVVEGKKGKAYIVKIRDYLLDKTFLIEPVHLRKIT